MNSEDSANSGRPANAKMMPTESQVTMKIDYTNWRGQRAIREIIPIRIFHGMNHWHQDFQWMIEAIDKETGLVRTFAMKNIHSYML